MLRPLLALALLTPAAQAQVLESRVPGLEIVALSDLPAAPLGAGARDECSGSYLDAPGTPGAQAVGAKGWRVTGEHPFGVMTAVSFVAGSVAYPNGICELINGKIAFFSGDRLVAILQATKDSTMIGKIRPHGDSGLQVFSGKTPDLIPFAKLHLVGTDGIALLPLPDEEPVCNGAAQVPNIYGLHIDEAHERILRAGWQPAEASEIDAPDAYMLMDLTDLGISAPFVCELIPSRVCYFPLFTPCGRA